MARIRAAIYGGGCKTQEGLINPLAADYRSRPGALPGTPTNFGACNGR
jgi:hypothetical protein